MYLSGPVTGRPNNNREAFDSAAKTLRAKGYDVINPLEEVSPEAHHEDAMLICLHRLTSWSACVDVDGGVIPDIDVLVQLEDWYFSPGARLEAEVAKACGIAIIAPGTLIKALDSKQEAV